jgi:hypothetical protein
MTTVDVYVDPSCPWAWNTSRWVKEVAPHRDLTVSWQSFCIEIRDEYGVAPTIPEHLKEMAIEGHALSHRFLRILEAARTQGGEEVVDTLYTEWGRRFFEPGRARSDALLAEVLDAAHLDAGLLDEADNDKWDEPIVAAMDIAYAFGGHKTQTPTIVIGDDPPHGFKGPVMTPAPTGEAALRFWDAIQVISREPGFFEITRPRANKPTPTPA